MLPLSLWVTGAATNDTHFQEYGLTPPSRLNHHWTYDEFADLGRKLTKYNADGSIDRYGAGLMNYPYWIHNAGGSIFDRLVDPTKPTLLTPEVNQALKFIEDAYHISRYARRSANQTHFASGNVSIYMHAGPNTTPYLQSAGANFEFSYAANPMLVRGGSENVTIGLALSSQSRNTEAAWKWMKFLATEAAPDHIAMTGRPVAWGPVAMDYQLHFENASPWEHVWVELISRPDSYNRMVASSQIISTWETYLREVLDGKTAPEIAMEKAQAQLEAVIPQYRLSN